MEIIQAIWNWTRIGPLEGVQIIGIGIGLLFLWTASARLRR